MDKRQLIMLQVLPLNIKVAKTILRIHEWVKHYGEENIYIAFSGGKDSIVLAHLVRGLYPSIPLVFSDTGLEFPEVRQIVSTYDNVEKIRHAYTFTKVIEMYGYPVVNKAVSSNLYKVRELNLTDKYKNYLLNGDERGKYGMIPKKHQYLIDADFKIGSGCCDAMKKRPFKKYEKQSGRKVSMTGEMADESRLREFVYMKQGCNAFDRKSGPKSTPLGFWTENDILEYIQLHNLDIPSVYGEIYQKDERVLLNGDKLPIYATSGESRTGCCFCLYGIGMEDKNDNRMIRLAKSNPNICKHCLKGGKYNDKGLWVPDKGLGMAHVLDVMKINYNKDILL